MNQDRIFNESEADRWFLRNRDDLHVDWERDVVLRLLRLYDVRPRRMIEVGAARHRRPPDPVVMVRR